LSHTTSQKETSTTLIEQLKALKARCDRLQVAYPNYFTCDDAKAWEKTIHSVFPDAIILQDIKHLINRLIELVGVTAEGVSQFSIDLHAAFTGTIEVPVRSRTTKVHMIAAPLDEPKTIIDRCENLIKRYRAIYPSIFSPSFDHAWMTQKPQIEKYIKDPVVDGIKTIFCSHPFFSNHIYWS